MEIYAYEQIKDRLDRVEQALAHIVYLLEEDDEAFEQRKKEESGQSLNMPRNPAQGVCFGTDDMIGENEMPTGGDFDDRQNY